MSQAASLSRYPYWLRRAFHFLTPIVIIGGLILGSRLLEIYENSPIIGFLYYFVPLGLVRIIFEITQRNPKLWLTSESPSTQLKKSWQPRSTLLLFMGAIILNIAILVRMIWHPGTGLGLLLMYLVFSIFIVVRAKWTTEAANSRLAADLVLIACLATFMSFAHRDAMPKSEIEQARALAMRAKITSLEFSCALSTLKRICPSAE